VKVSETGIPGIWVRRYPNGRKRFGWTAVYGGETYRRISKRNTLRGSVAEREKALGRLAAGLPVDEKPQGPPCTVKAVVADYLKACENLRCRRRYAAHAEELTRYFGDLPVSDLSQVAVAGFRKKRVERKRADKGSAPESETVGEGAEREGKMRLKKGASPATINRDLAFLRAALNHARGEGKIEGSHYFSDLSKADRRKVFVEEPRTAGIRRVTDKQFSVVAGRLTADLRPVARLLLATAMRKGEALGLVWGEVRGRTLYLTRTKSGKPREVPLTAEAAALLPERPADAEDSDLIFRGPDGGDLRHNFDRSWRAAREAAKLPWLRVHDLRHEAASRFLEAGATLRELQELGGWSSLELVERYSKVTRERIRETLSRVALPPVDSSAECTVSARAEKVEIRSLAK
jgi:integrase